MCPTSFVQAEEEGKEPRLIGLKMFPTVMMGENCHVFLNNSLSIPWAHGSWLMHRAQGMTLIKILVKASEGLAYSESDTYHSTPDIHGIIPTMSQPLTLRHCRLHCHGFSGRIGQVITVHVEHTDFTDMRNKLGSGYICTEMSSILISCWNRGHGVSGLTWINRDLVVLVQDLNQIEQLQAFEECIYAIESVWRWTIH